MPTQKKNRNIQTPIPKKYPNIRQYTNAYTIYKYIEDKYKSISGGSHDLTFNEHIFKPVIKRPPAPAPSLGIWYTFVYVRVRNKAADPTSFAPKIGLGRNV